MKIKMIMIVIGIVIYAGASHAAGCPDGFDEIQMENIQVTVTNDESCATNFEKYYEIDQQCTAHILD